LRFKLDENMPVVVADILRDSGYDAETVYSEAISGISDPELLDVCRHEHRILLTLDLDFANIVDYPTGRYPGIVIFRLSSVGPDAVLVAVRRWLLAAAESAPGPGTLWIVSNNRIRVRTTPNLG
jgi:predicted nuclease of predicted toxin-antitoxin system